MLSVQLQAVYDGPNPYADEPVLVAHLHCAGDASVLAGACVRLQQAFPAWLQEEEALSGNRPVLEYAAHTVVRWALAALNEVRGVLHSAGVAPVSAAATDTEIRLFLAFHQPQVSVQALELALRALLQAARPAPFSQADFLPALEKLWQMCRSHHPDYQARILMEGAAAMDLPVLPANGVARHWQFGWGARGRIFFESASNKDGMVAAQIARSKAATKAAFAALGVPAPRHLLVHTVEELQAAVDAVGWPCVTKPLDLGGGKGVSAGLSSLDQLIAGFEHARRYSAGPVMVEQFVPGIDYRLMVVNGRLTAAIRREPSAVVGDGCRSLHELVAELNGGRSSYNLAGSKYLRPVVLDAPALQHLQTQWVSPETVPVAGCRITLRSNANLSTGGFATDVSAQVHPHVRQMAEAIAQSLGLSTAGIDYITPDISRSWTEGNGGFIETNVTPALCLLVTTGWSPERIAADVLGHEVGRVPLAVAVVPDAAVPEALQVLDAWQCPPTFGWLCAGRACLGGMQLNPGTGRYREAAGVILRHRTVQGVLLVCDYTTLCRQGLPVDKAARISLFGHGLPAEWQAVLPRTARRFEQHDVWQAQQLRDLTSEMLADMNQDPAMEAE